MRQREIFSFTRRFFITMSKRIIALLLCAILIVPALSGCGGIDHEDDKGPYITMYLSDEIYDFDPINAYYNSATEDIVSMMFDTLFKLNEKGKIEKSLAKKYKTEVDEETGEYTMVITLKEAYWSNGTQIRADDFVYSWNRLLRSDSSHTAAALLYDIKNARLIKDGGAESTYIDELGVEVAATDTLIITFEGKPDIDQFLMNLTSVATAPVLESVVARNPDWAKRGSTIVTSGPYKLGKVSFVEDGGKEYDINGTNSYGNPLTEEGSFKTQKISHFYLERNAYYNRDPESDDIDKAVTNYRLLVDCSKTDAELLADFKDGKLFYMGDIPLSIRNDEYVKENVKLSNSLSTTVCYFNQNAMVKAGNTEYKLFADSNVRKALSFAVDREAIAEMMVYAEAATGLVAPGVFNTERGTDFRTIGGNILNKSPKMLEAKMFLANAGIIDQNGRNHAYEYSFTIKVPSYDDVLVAVANMVAGAWGEEGLGFDVTVELVNPIQNNDYFKEYDEISKDLCDDLFIEDLQQGDFAVAICDTVAYTPDAFSVLANYAAPFSGSAANTSDFSEVTANLTGYNNPEFNALIEAAYYVPYLASLTENDWSFLGLYSTPEEFKAVYNNLLKLYEKYGVTPSKDSDDWAAQRAIFLHAAEEVLMEDVPVIPLAFTKTAVLVSDELTNVKSNYYMPAIFTKTNVKDYGRFEYTVDKVNSKGQVSYDVNGDPIQEYKTIFDEFPVIDWGKVTE